MKKMIWVCVAAALMAGCQAHMMETHGDTITIIKLPNQRPGRGGVIRYLNTGFESWRRARRHDAESQMTHFCGGAYNVVEEGPRSKFGSSMPTESHVSLEVDQYWYIRFDCEK